MSLLEVVKSGDILYPYIATAKYAKSNKMSTKIKKQHAVNIEKILSRYSHIQDRYIGEYDELELVVEDLKQQGLRVVLTQGVYDLLHEGHAKYLEKALTYGDVLIVGVDTDEFTRARKGPNRPVVPFQERINMLAHLRHVTILTKRDLGVEIGELIRVVRPHVLVTSLSTKDFPKKDVLAYKKYCEEIVTLPPQAATTTTARIRFFTIEGADELARELTQRIPEVVLHTLNNFRKTE
ncbi:MAG: Bifunctional synthase/transferase [Candidatus Saccharibacteria bacterium GW2011_GWA2_46_10]|nr:MAG: Bifunctional synthase/transferase [Candidatus Saccharibacteria bacterium GW2011_GWA2_46_10]